MGEGNGLVRFAVSRQVTTGMAILGVLVLGGISLTRLPLEFLPTFSSSSITVDAPYASTSPEEVERLVVRPLEDSLGTISGVETLAATAGEGRGTVRLTFVDGTDMDLAAVEVRDRIDRARSLLPADLERITVRRFQSTDIPVIRLHLSSDWRQDRLYEFAETIIQRRIERLAGVAQVTLRGVRGARGPGESRSRALGGPRRKPPHPVRGAPHEPRESLGRGPDGTGPQAPGAGGGGVRLVGRGAVDAPGDRLVAARRRGRRSLRLPATERLQLPERPGGVDRLGQQDLDQQPPRGGGRGQGRARPDRSAARSRGPVVEDLYRRLPRRAQRALEAARRGLARGRVGHPGRAALHAPPPADPGGGDRHPRSRWSRPS